MHAPASCRKASSESVIEEGLMEELHAVFVYCEYVF